jgi:hypothetical protein
MSNSDLDRIRSDDQDLIAAVSELNDALVVAIAAPTVENIQRLTAAIQRYSFSLINRITVISGSDQMVVQRLVTMVEKFQLQILGEVGELRADVRALQERFVGGDSGEPYQ